MKTLSYDKRLDIKLKLLFNDVIDYEKASFIGIESNNKEVLSLWDKFNSIRKTLIQQDPEYISTTPEVKLPKPHQITEGHFHAVGTPVYKPEHFQKLRLAIENTLRKLRNGNRSFFC